jgi:exopolysaccharide production protein ExoZ
MPVPLLSVADASGAGEARTTLAVLQAARAVAALLVVLFHVTLSPFGSPAYGLRAPPFNRFFAFGHAGVEFFFVLSGFVILHVHWQDIGRPQRALSYLWKRIRRIYPLYWAILLPAVVAYLAVPSFGEPMFRDPGVILSSFLLVHFRTDIVVIYVAWTMYHEVLFYAAFALLILDRLLGTAVFTVWLLASAAALMTAPGFPLVFWSSPLHLLFAMGMAVAWRVRRGSVSFAAMIAVAGILVFVSSGVDEVYLGELTARQASMLYGLGAAMALAGLVSLEQDGRIRIPGALRLMGDASYSIYLVHLPVLSLLARLQVQARIAELLPPNVGFILMAALAVSPGVAVHVLVERPLLGLLSTSRRRPAAALI